MIKDYKNDEESQDKERRSKPYKTFADHIDAFTILVIVILFVAMIVAFLIEFIFDSFTINWTEIGVNAVIITACTVAIYMLVRSYSLRKGRKTDAWCEAQKEMQKKGQMIRDHGVAKHLTKYCRDWEDKRLESDIAALIEPVGITFEEFKKTYVKLNKQELYEKYLCVANADATSQEEKVTLTKYQIKILLRAKRIKRLKLDERYFYVNAEKRFLSGHRSPSSGITARQQNSIATARILITSILTSFLSATLLYDIIFDFSATSVIKCIIKIAITVVFGAIGMLGGYNHATIREVSEMKSKADDIDDFLKWCAANTEPNKEIN